MCGSALRGPGGTVPLASPHDLAGTSGPVHPGGRGVLPLIGYAVPEWSFYIKPTGGGDRISSSLAVSCRRVG